MRLSEYILSHMEKVLADWDDFARRNAPAGSDLSDLIESVGADRARFLRWAGVSDVGELPAAKLGEATRLLKQKGAA